LANRKPGPLNWLPGFRLLLTYDRSNLAKDLTSGLVVVLVLIPSAIAYSDLAKCSPIAGLYAALGGMFVFALFTSSRHVIVGPDAAVCILVGAAIGPFSDGDTGKTVALSAWLAFLVAIMLMVAAWLRLGAAADFLSAPVMLGFMNGAAVVILVSQLGKLSGIALHEENTLLKFLEWVSHFSQAHWPTLAIGLAGVAALACLKRWVPRIPGTIVVFALAMIAGRAVDFKQWNMPVIGPVDTSMPSPVPPELDLSDIGRLMVSALGLAMLIFPEGILLGRAMAQRHQYEIDPNRELFAMGMANLAAGLFRGFAVAGSQSRTLLNSATGGRTQLVSVIAALLLIVFVVFLASWIATLPVVAIAAILVFTAITLFEVKEVIQLWQKHRASAILSLSTSAGVIAFGVLPGILVGVVLSLLRLISQIAHPHDAVLGRVPGSGAVHDLGDDSDAKVVPGLLIYRFYGPLVFANVRLFIERLNHHIANANQPVRQVVVDARAINDIDVTAVDQLRSYVAQLSDRQIAFVVAKASRPLRKTASRLGLRITAPNAAYFPRLSDAVAAFERSETPSQK
jgi:SulP family sulfate permease